MCIVNVISIRRRTASSAASVLGRLGRLACMRSTTRPSPPSPLPPLHAIRRCTAGVNPFFLVHTDVRISFVPSTDAAEGAPTATEDETSVTHHRTRHALATKAPRARARSAVADGLWAVAARQCRLSSGRALASIEDYLREAILPTYGNSHTPTAKTGRQSSDFVAEARIMEKKPLRCNDRGKNAKRVRAS